MPQHASPPARVSGGPGSARGSSPRGRRPSWLWLVAVVVLVGAVVVAVIAVGSGHSSPKESAAAEASRVKQANAANQSHRPSQANSASGSSVPSGPVAAAFAPYVDLTTKPVSDFQNPVPVATTNVILGFVVGARNSCDPLWAGLYPLDAAATDPLDLDARIAQLRQRNAQVTVSFGGQGRAELAIGCQDQTALAAAYKSVVDRYSLTSIDLDIEGNAASAEAVDERRATAIASVQASERAAGHALGVWLTLPIEPNGLDSSGQAVLKAMLAAKVSITGVNALTMDYGTDVPTGQTMADMAASSLTALERQLNQDYAAVGTPLSAAETWQRMGATAMIGQNDSEDENFSLADATTLIAFARTHHLAQLSIWSLNRDKSCAAGVDTSDASSNCSGVTQQPGQFSALFQAFAAA
jgi:chitinase